MLQKVGPDVIYCDTDSIKFVNDHRADFEEINKVLQKKAIDAGAYADNRKGKRYYLGTWDEEHSMIRFKTLGAKKYIFEEWEYLNNEGKEWKKGDGAGHWERATYSTIAGVNKKRGREFFQERGFTAFENGTVIEQSGHLVAYRNDDQVHKINIDGCVMTTAANIALVDDTYTLGVTSSYLELLRAVMDDVEYYEKEI